MSIDETNPVDIIFNKDGTKLFVVGQQNDSIYEHFLSTPFDISTLSEVQVTKSIVSEDNVPTAIIFNRDGTKLFLLGQQNASIYEYGLTTPFAIVTLSVVQTTKSLVSEDNAPVAMSFNKDGTKLFIVGDENNSIYEYALSTPFDISTLSGVQVTKSIGSEDTDPRALKFNRDGTKLFLAGQQNDSVYEYDLTTPFDISTLSDIQSTVIIPSSDTIPAGITFINDGTILYVTGNDNDRLYAYDLTTPFDISTTSIIEAPPIIGYDLNNLSAVQVTKSVATEDANPRDIIFNNDGTKIYVCGSQNESIYEYNLITAFDLSTLSAVQSIASVNSEDTFPRGITFNNDGTKIYVIGNNGFLVTYDLNNLSAVQVTESVATEDTIPQGVVFNDDGTKVFMVGGGNDSIYEYNLGTAFDLSTKSAVQATKSVSSEDIEPAGIIFNNDGTKLFMVGSENDSIYEYDLSTAYDISTMSTVQVTKSVASEDITPGDIAFNNNGTKIFMVGGGSSSIHEYNLTTAFDLSTLSVVQVSKSIASEETFPQGMAFNDDGTKIFICGIVGDSIYEYDLSTAFDLSTLSLIKVTKSVASEETNPLGIALNNDGTKIFMVGSDSDSIHEYDMSANEAGINQYNLSTAFDVSTLSVVQVRISVELLDNSPSDFTFNSNGTKLFIIGTQKDLIHEHSLSIAYDLLTLSAVQATVSVATEDTSPTDLIFNDIGDKLFMAGNQNDSIFEYDLDTAFDISTLSSVQVTKSVNSEDASPRGIAFNDDGTKIFMVGNSNDAIHEYNL